MKKTHTLISAFLLSTLLFFASCSKSTEDAIVNRDCTGTYLTLNGKDYKVCNPDMTASFLDGAQINVRFKKKSSCDLYNDIYLCELYHKSYGFVEIIDIK